jgi:SAM-dependent methyltransferase
VTDPSLDGVYRWWHLSVPSPELIEAEAESWLGAPGTAVDIGCGAGTEAAYLATRGWRTVGIDLSRPALDRALRGRIACTATAVGNYFGTRTKRG